MTIFMNFSHFSFVKGILLTSGQYPLKGRSFQALPFLTINPSPFTFKTPLKSTSYVSGKQLKYLKQQHTCALIPKPNSVCCCFFGKILMKGRMQVKQTKKPSRKTQETGLCYTDLKKRYQIPIIKNIPLKHP